MAESLFRKEVLENQGERLWGEVIVAQPLSFSLLTSCILVVLIVAACYLYWGTYSRKETVSGYLLPDKGVVNIKANRGGTVETVLVKEGSHVNAGQPLVKLRIISALNDGQNADSLLIEELKKQETGLKQTIQTEKERRTSQIAKIGATDKGLHQEIQALRQELSISKQQLDLSRKAYLDLNNLRKANYISQSRYRKAYSSYLQLQQQVDDLSRTLIDKRNTLTLSQYKSRSIALNTEESIEQLESKISGIDQELIKQKVQGEYSLEAPISGIVSALQAVEGQSANPQHPLVSIIPSGGHLQAQLYVPSRAIGFVKIGLPVQLRYNAFPYQRFGSHQGQIVQVAHSILTPGEIPAPIQLHEPVYRVTSSLAHTYVKAYGKRLNLTPGMLLKADIVLDRRPLYQWLFKPLYSLQGTL